MTKKHFEYGAEIVARFMYARGIKLNESDVYCAFCELFAEFNDKFDGTRFTERCEELAEEFYNQ